MIEPDVTSRVVPTATSPTYRRADGLLGMESQPPRNEGQLDVFGVLFSQSSMTDILHDLQYHLASGSGPRMIVTANLDHVVRLSDDSEFRAAYKWASIATIDGWPVLLYARLRTRQVISRVTGADLVEELFLSLDPREDRVFVVAANQTVAEHMKSWAQSRKFPAGVVACAVPAFGFERDRAQSDELAQTIHDHRASHVLMGIGAPKSEKWCFAHRDMLGDCHILCIGAGIEFFLGLKRRAPRLLRLVGLEFAWRLLSEPRRLFRRYLVDSWGIFRAIRHDLLSSGFDQRSHPTLPLRTPRGE